MSAAQPQLDHCLQLQAAQKPSAHSAQRFSALQWSPQASALPSGTLQLVAEFNKHKSIQSPVTHQYVWEYRILHTSKHVAISPTFHPRRIMKRLVAPFSGRNSHSFTPESRVANTGSSGSPSTWGPRKVAVVVNSSCRSGNCSTAKPFAQKSSGSADKTPLFYKYTASAT